MITIEDFNKGQEVIVVDFLVDREEIINMRPKRMMVEEVNKDSVLVFDDSIYSKEDPDAELLIFKQEAQQPGALVMRSKYCGLVNGHFILFPDKHYESLFRQSVELGRKALALLRKNRNKLSIEELEELINKLE